MCVSSNSRLLLHYLLVGVSYKAVGESHGTPRQPPQEQLMSVLEKRKLDGHRARCEDVVRQTRLPKITLHRAFLKCTETCPQVAQPPRGEGGKQVKNLSEHSGCAQRYEGNARPA